MTGPIRPVHDPIDIPLDTDDPTPTTGAPTSENTPPPPTYLPTEEDPIPPVRINGIPYAPGRATIPTPPEQQETHPTTATGTAPLPLIEARTSRWWTGWVGDGALGERVGWWAVRGWRAVGDGVWWAAGVWWRWPVRGSALLASGWWFAPATVRQAVTLCVFAAVLAGLTGGRAAIRVRVASLHRVVKYRKYRRRTRSRYVAAMANAGMVKTPTTGDSKRKLYPRLLATRPHPHGITLHIDPSPIGAGVQQFIDHSATIANTMGALGSRATLINTWRGRAVQLDLRWQEPFPATIRPEDLPPAKGFQRVTTALDEDGNGLERNPRLPTLVVAAQGGGKSTEVWSLLYQLYKAGLPVRLRIFDPKGGTELGMLEEVCWQYESNPARWSHFLAKACGGLQVRQGLQKQAGLLNTPWNEEFPLDLMIIDELVTVLAMSRGTMRAFGQEVGVRDALAVYLSQARAANASVFALSQLGEKEVIGPARGLFTYISCLRVNPTEKALVDVLLGQGAHHAYPAHQLQPGPETAGIGWTTTERSGVVRYRGAEPTMEQRQELIEWLRGQVEEQRRRHGRDPEPEKAPAKKAAPRRRKPPAGQRTTEQAVTETAGAEDK